MARQRLRVTGNTASRYNPAQSILQSKIAMLPSALAANQQKQIIARDTAFQNKQMSLARKKQRMEEEAAARGMGLEAAKMGVTLGMSDFGSKTIGDVTKSAKGAWNSMWNKKPAFAAGTNTKLEEGNMFSDFNLGGSIASGLTGYGVGKLVGGKNKTKKSLYGAGAGALMGLLSAKPGNSIYSGISGLFSGGLGGFFS